MKKIVRLSILAALILGMSSTGSTVFADTQTSTQTSTVESEAPSLPQESLTLQEIQDLDQYVTVQDNRYVLNIPATADVSAETLAAAKAAISQSNQFVTQNGDVINSANKVAYPLVTLRSAKAHQIDHLWYGVRHIFRTNNAVAIWTSGLNRVAAGNAGIAVVDGLVFGPWGAAVSGLSSAWGWSLASYTDHFNAVHSKSHIAIYVSYALAYWGTTWS